MDEQNRHAYALRSAADSLDRVYPDAAGIISDIRSAAAEIDRLQNDLDRELAKLREAVGE